MKRSLYKGIDPVDNNEAYFVIEGGEVAPFFGGYLTVHWKEKDIDYWSRYGYNDAQKVIEAIPNLTLVEEIDV